MAPMLTLFNVTYIAHVLHSLTDHVMYAHTEKKQYYKHVCIRVHKNITPSYKLVYMNTLYYSHTAKNSVIDFCFNEPILLASILSSFKRIQHRKLFSHISLSF